MLRLRLVFLVLLGAAVRGSLLAAQDAPALEPGARIRITFAGPASRPDIRHFLGISGDLLTVSDRSGPLAIRLADLGRLEVSRGRRLGLAGGIVGAVLGAASGVAVACAANRDSYGVYCAGQDDTKLVGGLILGGAVGGVVGAYLFRRDRWEPLDLARLRGR